MDASELELFERSVGQATENQTGDALDSALLEVGWLDALADDPYTAVSILFPLQGSTNATSRAIEQVVTAALGRPPTDAEAVVLPALGTPTAPGQAATINSRSGAWPRRRFISLSTPCWQWRAVATDWRSSPSRPPS